MPYEPRHLDWPDCLNARDLGGIPTRDGRRLRTGGLIRSDRHSRLTADGIATVRAAGVTRIVDLRTEEECATEPSPLAGSVPYVNVAWTDTVHDLPETATMGDRYRARLDRHGTPISAAIATLAEAPPGGVVVHCAIGKDRTGLVIALLLDLVGVDARHIVDDYVLSGTRLAESFAEELAAADSPQRRATLVSNQSCQPEFMLETLAHLHDRHGGTEAYLRRNGVTANQVASLTTRLLDGS